MFFCLLWHLVWYIYASKRKSRFKHVRADTDMKGRYRNNLYQLRGYETQESFAEKVGMSQQRYSAYENGKSELRAEMIKDFCQRFGCTADWLLDFDGAVREANPEGLTSQEMKLVSDFRLLTDEHAETLRLMLSLLAASDSMVV